MNTGLKDFTSNKLIHVKRSDWTAFDLERLGTFLLCAWIPLPSIAKGFLFADLTKYSKANLKWNDGPMKVIDFPQKVMIFPIHPQFWVFLQKLFWYSKIYLFFTDGPKHFLSPNTPVCRYCRVIIKSRFWQCQDFESAWSYHPSYSITRKQSKNCDAELMATQTQPEPFFAPFLFKLHSSLGVDCHLTIK